jgi:hypothetical protein
MAIGDPMDIMVGNLLIDIMVGILLPGLTPPHRCFFSNQHMDFKCLMFKSFLFSMICGER